MDIIEHLKGDWRLVMDEFEPFQPSYGSYKWVIIKYDGHDGIACDWEDCLEEIIFIDGYDDYKNTYIEYNDPKLTFCKTIMVRK